MKKSFQPKNTDAELFTVIITKSKVMGNFHFLLFVCICALKLKNKQVLLLQ